MDGSHGVKGLPPEQQQQGYLGTMARPRACLQWGAWGGGSCRCGLHKDEQREGRKRWHGEGVDEPIVVSV